jgi:uncharacterized membrane protein YeiH
MSKELFYALDLFGTFAFALSGAFRAVKYELDILGVLVLATMTGVGGGVIRDMILGSTPAAVFLNEIYLFICLGGGLLVFVAANSIARRWDAVLFADALGLGVFTALGCAKAEQFGLGVAGVIFMGTLSACGGGVIRDMLVREIPAVIQADFYASAAILGGGTFVALKSAGVDFDAAMILSALVTIGLRLLAMKFHFHLPRVRSLEKSPSQIARDRKLSDKF